MSWPFVLAGLTLTIFAGGSIIVALRRIMRRRWLSGGCYGFAGAALLLVLGTLAALALNLYTYHRMTYEQPVAELRIDKLDEQYYRVALLRPDSTVQVFTLRGDEWQIDARIMKWQGLGTWLGLDTLYRLERLSGRYRDIEQARSESQSVFQLAPRAGLDLWKIAQRYSRWLPLMDTTYGSAAYLPMGHGARFRISMTASGIAVRPANVDAEQALEAWL